MGNLRPITIGEIDYANAWPLFKSFSRHARELNYELISRVPAELNRLLHAGELDVSAISSFSYGQYSQDYVLLPGLSVGSIGRVHSILLFTKEPLEKRLPRRIAVTTTSATSVNLLKIIMAMRFECEPEYVPAEPKLQHMLKDADGALLIGDPAITASWQREGLHVMDLGEAWNDWTGLGMTYAVVAARRTAAEKQSEELSAVFRALHGSKDELLGQPEALIKLACERIGGEETYWSTYFKSLRYDFDEKLQAGLSLYFKYAKELSLLQHEVDLSFYEEQSPQKVNE
ncbi:menaquinone biosynthesis protein [Paenibacillus soyae]|uniref:Chorismate dehydratase n=1 Tax=Paenibacillus soyae TaxID=2969249 RepID=A0A9X2S778_9BACL|nr:menaquinone biosynthesis protein [Paenibacillus soyae]MCR2803014.1 menaquinone biosynthesis protein [Paenibacillus soyae]